MLVLSNTMCYIPDMLSSLRNGEPAQLKIYLQVEDPND